jgi:glycosyltransferase involved in cell wall biosynthesis
MSPFPPGNSAKPWSESSTKLRILHAVFSSRIAGSERYCIDLANHQAALGHEVHVAGAASSPLAAELAPGVRFHGFSRLLRGWRLRRLVRQLAPDVCHGHLSAACKALGRAKGPHRRVATLHVGYKPHQHGRLDGLICVNRAQAGRIDGYNGMVRTIPNWLPSSATAGSAHGIRAELGLAPDTLVIGSVGRLHESKGVDVLVSAFRAAAPTTAALVIAGEGPQRAELERLCAGDPRVHFVGYRADVAECLHGFDLFVSPSREESFGLAIIEAMSAGLPVIATATEGPSEYLRDQPVTLVPAGDEAALATAIRENAARFSAGQLTNVTYDLRAFDPAVRIGHIMDFYGQVISARPAAVTGWLPATAT